MAVVPPPTDLPSFTPAAPTLGLSDSSGSGAMRVFPAGMGPLASSSGRSWGTDWPRCPSPPLRPPPPILSVRQDGALAAWQCDAVAVRRCRWSPPRVVEFTKAAI